MAYQIFTLEKCQKILVSDSGFELNLYQSAILYKYGNLSEIILKRKIISGISKFSSFFLLVAFNSFFFALNFFLFLPSVFLSIYFFFYFTSTQYELLVKHLDGKVDRYIIDSSSYTEFSNKLFIINKRINKASYIFKHRGSHRFIS